jgi:hypothetical protein
MEKNFSTSQILEAVELLLQSKKDKNTKNIILEKKNILPPDTESIIKQAENYLKKN